MRPPRDSTAARWRQEFEGTLQHLNQEPEGGKKHRLDLEKQGQEEDRHDDDQPRIRKEPDVAADHPGDCPRRPQRRDVGQRIEKGVGERCGDACCEIEDEVREGAEPVFDSRAENPQRPHVENQVEPSAMEKHVGHERQIVCRPHPPRGIEVPRRDQREPQQQPFLLGRTERDLKQEDRAVARDQTPGDDRRVAGRNPVLDRKHQSTCRSSG
jgi:hypothetical protein